MNADISEKDQTLYAIERIWCSREEPNDVWYRDEYGRRILNHTVQSLRDELWSSLRREIVDNATTLLEEALRRGGMRDEWIARGRPLGGTFVEWFKARRRMTQECA